MKIKRFPKHSLRPQRADGVSSLASRRKSLITKNKVLGCHRGSLEPRGAKLDDAAKLREVNCNLTIRKSMRHRTLKGAVCSALDFRMFTALPHTKVCGFLKRCDIKEFFKLFEDSLRDLYKNPIFVVPGLVLWVFLFWFSKLSVLVNYQLSNSIAISAWVFFFFLVSLCVMGFVFSGLIGVSKDVVALDAPRKTKPQESKILDGTKVQRTFVSPTRALRRGNLQGLLVFFKFGGKYWFRNFIVLLFLAAIGAAIGQAAHYGAFYIGRAFDLEMNFALGIFILIYLIGLLGVLIFLSFSNFCAVIFDLGIVRGVKSSVRLVKRNYLAALSMSVILFVVLFLFNKFSGRIAEVIEYGILLPYFASVLTRFVIKTGR